MSASRRAPAVSASTIHPREVVKPQLVTLTNRHMVLVFLESTLITSPCRLRANMSVYVSVFVVLVCAPRFAETSRCCASESHQGNFPGLAGASMGQPDGLEACCPLEHGQCIRTPYPSLHSVAHDPAWPNGHRRQLGCGLKEQYSAFPISYSGLRKDISRSQPASQPASLGPASCFHGCAFLCFCSRLLIWVLMPILLPNSARAPRHARIACAEGIVGVFLPALRSTSLGQRRNPTRQRHAGVGFRTEVQVGRRILGHGGTGSGWSKVSFSGVCSGHLLATRNRRFPCTHPPPLSRDYSPLLGNDLSRFAFFS